jgi:hypothetical protein
MAHHYEQCGTAASAPAVSSPGGGASKRATCFFPFFMLFMSFMVNPFIAQSSKTLIPDQEFRIQPMF